MIEIYGIPVSEMTIHYIATVLQKTKSFACADGSPTAVFAVGRFQIVAGSFYGGKEYYKIDGDRGILNKIPDIYTNAFFDKETQDALATYLVIVKKHMLGKYILGYNNDSVAAQEAMAQEWAAKKLFAKTFITDTRMVAVLDADGKRIIDPVTKKVKREKKKDYYLYKGDGYYAGVGGNGSRNSKQDAEKTQRIIREVRKEIMSSNNELLKKLRKSAKWERIEKQTKKKVF